MWIGPQHPTKQLQHAFVHVAHASQLRTCVCVCAHMHVSAHVNETVSDKPDWSTVDTATLLVPGCGIIFPSGVIILNF